MRRLSTFQLSIIAFCAALNAGVGFLVYLLKIPLYLDLIGSIIAAVLLGPLYGVIVAILGIIILGLITVPTAFAYLGTAIAITLLAYLFSNYGYLKTWPRTIGFGIVLGGCSAVLSAPVTVYLFGGISFVGADAFTVFFKAMGQNIVTSVFLGGLATDPVDKVLTSAICLVMLRRLPRRFTEKISSRTGVVH